MLNTEVIICDCDHEDIIQETEVFSRENIQIKWLKCKTQEEVIASCKGAKVLLNQYVLMDEKIFKALPTVKCIVRYGVGVDNVNLDDANKFGVQICNVPDYGTREVADQGLALMMALVRKVCFTNKLIRENIWDYRKEIPILRLSDCTVGICGVGRIGSEFAKRVAALGCKVIAYDVEDKNQDRIFPDFIEFVPFDELLKRSDVISIHCPLNDTTYHMFGKNEFSKMKKNAYIVNVARGGIIDEDALLWALEEKEISGAGLDVVEKEPLTSDNPLLSFDNFVISPHTAWYSEQSAIDLNRKVAEEGLRFLKGEKVHYPVNKISSKGECKK